MSSLRPELIEGKKYTCLKSKQTNFFTDNNNYYTRKRKNQSNDIFGRRGFQNILTINLVSKYKFTKFWFQ